MVSHYHRATVALPKQAREAMIQLLNSVGQVMCDGVFIETWRSSSISSHGNLELTP
jgi:hypothetical protein